MADLSLSDAPCKAWASSYREYCGIFIDELLGSDVKPCVWAVVEVCLGILGACLPTFPALFHWMSVRSNRKPSRMPNSESADSSQYAVLTPDESRSGRKSGIENAQKDFMKMIDWANVPKAAEEGNSAR